MNAFQDFVLTMSQLPPMPPMCLIFLWARRSSHSVTWLCKELLTMLIMVNLVVIFVGVPANRRRERSRCKSAEVATPARRLLLASPAQARQESRCSDTAASSFAWVGGWVGLRSMRVSCWSLPMPARPEALQQVDPMIEEGGGGCVCWGAARRGWPQWRGGRPSGSATWPAEFQCLTKTLILSLLSITYMLLPGGSGWALSEKWNLLSPHSQTLPLTAEQSHSPQTFKYPLAHFPSFLSLLNVQLSAKGSSLRKQNNSQLALLRAGSLWNWNINISRLQFSWTILDFTSAYNACIDDAGMGWIFCHKPKDEQGDSSSWSHSLV